ncbi:MAG: hypothetical protein IPJ84_20900 [Bdellovibrionales bacterium]|nr:hypothetical protein [Bdellovibrionales bacterium]
MAMLAVQVLISRPAKADDSEPTSSRGGDGTPVIFDVRRSLPMEPDEPVYHDFYISAGVEAGIKKGQFLPVARQMPVHDPIQNKQQALLTIAVGKLQVIHVERNMAVARLVSELSDDERPTLEYEAVMIGDRVDLRGATMEAPKDATTQKARRKRKAAQLDDAPAAPYVPVAPHVPVAPAIVAPAAAPAAPEKVSMSVPPPKA